MRRTVHATEEIHQNVQMTQLNSLQLGTDSPATAINHESTHMYFTPIDDMDNIPQNVNYTEDDSLAESQLHVDHYESVP